MKNDLISRQAAIDALGDEPEVWSGKDEYDQGLNNQWHYDRNAILAVPSAQPEIIRCKDCKYCEHWYADKGRCFLWHESGIDVFGDGFCNYAKRRTDGN